MKPDPKSPLTWMEQLWLWIIIKDIGKMNQTQVLALVRQVLMFAGAFLTTKGYLSAEQVGGLGLLLTQVGGPLLTVVPIIWSLFVHTKAATVARAADIVPIAPQAQREAGVASPVLVPTNPKIQS